QTSAVNKISITQTALANQQATIQARLTATPRPPVEPLSLTPGGYNPVIPLLSPLYVFVRGQDGLIYYKLYKNGSWADWKSLQPPPVGITMDSPSVVAQGDSRIDLFVRGQDGALWHAVSDGVSWTAWESLGGQLTSGPAAVLAR